MNNSNLCYVVNLPERKDRFNHIIDTFYTRKEFDVRMVDPVPQKSGALSLWLTIKRILVTVSKDLPFFILCEDDHEFISHYSFSLWQRCINEAQQFDADVLCGGVSWFKTGVQVSENLFWVEKFSGLQFTVIFQKFYQTIFNASFAEFDQADFRISDLTEKKFVIYPFISVQKDFGYSDVTSRNDRERRVERLFAETSERFNLLQKIKTTFTCNKNSYLNLSQVDLESIYFPLYKITKQFYLDPCSKTLSTLFDYKFIRIASNHFQTQWEALRDCIEIAKKDGDDFIIVTFQSFELKEDFTKLVLVNNILSACCYNCEILLGDIEKFNHAVPLSENLFWIDSFSHSSFIILFSGAYKKIVSTPPVPGDVNIYNYLSYVTSRKMAFYPFITKSRKSFEEFESNIKFQEHGGQLAVYQKVINQYQLENGIQKL